MALPKYPMMSIEDYFLLDRNSLQSKYEYLDGDLIMMAGGSPAHARIAANLITIINSHLRDSPCIVYTSDARLQLAATRYVHPDVLVSCDPREEGENLRFPRLVIEVLSPTTEVIDRGRKFTAYRECQTLEDYVLVESRSQAIEVYHREGNAWVLRSFGPGDEAVFNSIDLRFPVADVYAKVRFE